MEYPKQEEKKNKYGKEEFKKDVEEAVVKGVKRAKPKKKSSKYAALSTKELYAKVVAKRDEILLKKHIPKKIPRGRAALEALCKKLRLK